MKIFNKKVMKATTYNNKIKLENSQIFKRFH